MSNVHYLNPPGSAQTISFLGREFSVFVIECPYDNYSLPEVRELLPRVFELKIRGYQKEHPYGILPVDSYDQVGNHILVAEKLNGSWIPRMGFKSVTAQRCLLHQLNFPLHNYLKGAPPEHRLAVEALISEHLGSKQNLGYNGSWTMDPELRRDPEYRLLLRDLTRALLVHYYRDYQIPTTSAFAVMRFKVHEEKMLLGWEYMKIDGQPLPTFQCESFFRENVAFMEWRQPSKFALEVAEQYREFWDKRITLGKARDISESFGIAA